MKVVYVERIEEEVAFVKRAAEHFRENPKTYTYTDEEIDPGALFAVLWTKDSKGKPDSILVFEVGEKEPTVYGNVDS